MGKPVHKLLSIRAVNWNIVDASFGCGFWTILRRLENYHFTTEDSGVTCKNCLKSMKARGR